MAINYYIGDRLTGLSTDPKPTGLVGWIFDELDTGLSYIHDGTEWVRKHGKDSWRFIKPTMDNQTLSLFKNDRVFVDVSQYRVNLILPLNPELGDVVVISDYKLNSSNNNITVYRNSNNILSQADDLSIDLSGATVELIYSDSTVGWMIVQR